MRYIALGAGFFLGALGAFLVSFFGEKMLLIDYPTERSSHSCAIPKGGGVGILAAFCLYSVWSDLPFLFWFPTAAISMISLVGDRTDIPAKLRLMIQFVAAGFTSWAIVLIHLGFSSFQGVSVLLCILLISFYLVITANVYNFMDGIDGLAGITAFIAFSLLAVTGWYRGETMVTVILSAVISSASLGFLFWNFPKAKVFMGDVGSIFLGFVFAVMVLIWSDSVADFLMFSAFIYPFFADELLTQTVRLKNRESLMKAHRRHIYQILANQMKIPHWQVTLLYAVLQIIVAVLAVLIHSFGWMAEAGLLIVLFFLAWKGAIWTRRYE